MQTVASILLSKVHQSALEVGTLESITNDLTQLTDAGHFTGVKGQLQVGLRPLGQPLLFLFHACLIGLEALQLETGVFPQCSEAGKRLFQYFTSVHVNSDLENTNKKKVVLVNSIKKKKCAREGC